MISVIKKYYLFLKDKFYTNTVKEIAVNSSWLMMDRIVRALGGFFVGLWVARYLGPEDFGVYTYALALVSFFVPLQKLGLDGIVLRELVKNPDSERKIMGSALGMKLMGAILMFVISTIMAYFLNRKEPVIFMMVVIYACGYLFRPFVNIETYFRAKMQNKYAFIGQNIGYVFSLLVRVLLILIGASVIYFSAAFSLQFFIAMIALVFIYNRMSQTTIWQWKFSWKESKFLLKDSWPLIFAGIFSALLLKVDQVMLGNMSDNKGVGLYNAAVRISELTYLLPMIFIRSSHPILVKTFNLNKKEYFTQLRKLLLMLNVIAYLLVILVILFSDNIILFLFGNEYFESHKILMIHIISSIFVFIGNPVGIWIINENKTKFSLISKSIGLIINVVLNVILIPNYGGLGAAYATLISYFISYVFINLFYSKTRGFFILQMEAIFMVNVFRFVKRKKSY